MSSFPLPPDSDDHGDVRLFDKEQVLEHKESDRVAVSAESSHYGHNIKAVAISDRAQTHLGDVHNHYYVPDAVSENVLDKLMDALKFEHMDSRIRNVATATPTTCDWLFKSREVLQWIEQPGKSNKQVVLWIRGKPGSGKSTMMKKLLTWSKHRVKSDMTLAFFFNARSHSCLEKTNIGAYRSLTYQLLYLWPESRPLFLAHFASKIGQYKLARDVSDISGWTEIELQEFLIELFANYSVPTTNMFVDALDECEEQQVQSLVTFLCNLNHHAQAKDPSKARLRVCLASRHYPHLTVTDSITLTVENEADHKRDMSAYIRRTLRVADEKLSRQVEEKILDRAAGIFLWVVLIIPLLNDAYFIGQGSGALEERLQRLPQGLHQTFELILSHSALREETIVIFQWLLASKRSLSPVELFIAVQCSMRQVVVSNIRVVSVEAAWNYLHLNARGLVEVYNTAYGETVQFIHESVREYLRKSDILIRMNLEGQLSTMLARWSAAYQLRSTAEILAALFWLSVNILPLVCNRYVRQFTSIESGSNRSESQMLANCHDRLARGCLVYLSLYQHHPMDFVLEDSRCLDQYGRFYPSFTDTFRGYTATNFFAHAEQAQALGLSQLHLLSELATSKRDSRGGISVWSSSGQLLEIPNDTMPLLCILAADGMAHLVAAIVKDLGVDINISAQYYGTPLMLACHFSTVGVIQTLLNLNADANAQAGIHCYTLHTAALVRSASDRHQVMRILLNAGADARVSTTDGNVLHALALRGRYRGRAEDAYETARMLIRAGADVNLKRQCDGRSPLELASLHREIEIVRALVNGTDLELCQYALESLMEDSTSSTAHLSSEVEDTEKAEIRRLLIDRGCDLQYRSQKTGKSALEIAAENGNSSMVEELLESGMNPRQGVTMSLVTERLSKCTDPALSKEYQLILRLLDKANLRTSSGTFEATVPDATGSRQAASVVGFE